VRQTIIAAAIVFCSGMLVAPASFGAGTTAEQCASAKMKAAGKAYAAKAKCYAAALGSSTNVDSECLAKAETKFDAQFAKIDADGDCPAGFDSSSVGADVDTCVAELADRFAAQDCGDGILAADETCDDGDRDDGDGCNSSCQLEATCPCWTTESLNAAFSPTYFSENGRGGELCHVSSSTGPGDSFGSFSTDVCPDNTQRSGIEGNATACLVYADQDPENDGSCVRIFDKNISGFSTNEGVACFFTWAKAAFIDQCTFL